MVIPARQTTTAIQRLSAGTSTTLMFSLESRGVCKNTVRIKGPSLAGLLFTMNNLVTQSRMGSFANQAGQ